MPGELAVHGFVDVLVTGSHHLRRAEHADEPDQQAGDGGLKILGPAGQCLEPGTQLANAGGKRYGSQTADDPEDRIGDEFGGIPELRPAGIRKSGSEPRNQRMTTTLETAERTTEPRMPAVQRPMTSSMTKSTAEIGALKAAASPAAAPTGRDQAHSLPRQMQAASEGRGDTGADLQRRIFGPQGVSRSDGQRRRDELADGGAEGNIAVIDVERGLGLIDPAAARSRENVDDQHGDDQAGEAGGQQHPDGRERVARSQEIDAAPLNGEAEADNGEGGEDSDEDRKDQEEMLFA